jgi:hypothetical protein
MTIEIVSLWGLRRGNEEGVPELMVAWDEFCMEDNPEGFWDHVREEREAWGTDLVEERLIRIRVSEEAILGAFAAPIVNGEALS